MNGVGTAAVGTLMRIARHKKAAKPAARELLDVIENRLLDPEFSASKLNPEEPVYKTMQAFRAATGLHPGDSIAFARGIVAARLLCDTDLSQDRLARLAGLSDKSALRKLCLRLFGRRPGRLRAEARKARRAGREPVPTLDQYRRFLAGELGSNVVSDIAARRERRERELGLPISRGPLMFKLAPTALDHQLEMLCLYPHRKRLDLLRKGIYLGSKEVFEALSERSRKEGRLSRGSGVELAEIALASVEGCLADLGAEKADHLALGWARLGNARRLAADLEGADGAMREAEVWAETAAQRDRVRAEVSMLKGTLRLFQRRFTEALAAYNRAVALSEVARDGLLLIDTLFQRASLHLYCGEPEEAMPDLDMARHLIPYGDKRRRVGVAHHLLGAALLVGDTERARKLLPEARRLTDEADDLPGSLQNRWLEGQLLRQEGCLEDAEPFLKEARAGFLKIGEVDMTAIVSLELALLYQEQGGRADQVASYAANALPALEALNIPEAFRAFELLRDAIRENHFHRSVLEFARRSLLAPGAS